METLSYDEKQKVLLEQYEREYENLSQDIHSSMTTDWQHVAQALQRVCTFYRSEFERHRVEMENAQRRLKDTNERMNSLEQELSRSKSLIRTYEELPFKPNDADIHRLNQSNHLIKLEIEKYSLSSSGQLNIPPSARSLANANREHLHADLGEVAYSKDGKVLQMINRKFQLMEELVFTLKARLERFEEHENVRTLITKYGTLDELLRRNEQLEKDNERLKKREERYESNTLLRWRHKFDITPNSDKLYSLMIALQIELGNTYQVLDRYNLEKNPTLRLLVQNPAPVSDPTTFQVFDELSSYDPSKQEQQDDDMFQSSLRDPQKMQSRELTILRERVLLLEQKNLSLEQAVQRHREDSELRRTNENAAGGHHSHHASHHHHSSPHHQHQQQSPSQVSTQVQVRGVAGPGNSGVVVGGGGGVGTGRTTSANGGNRMVTSSQSGRMGSMIGGGSEFGGSPVAGPASLLGGSPIGGVGVGGFGMSVPPAPTHHRPHGKAETSEVKAKRIKELKSLNDQLYGRIERYQEHLLKKEEAIVLQNQLFSELSHRKADLENEIEHLSVKMLRQVSVNKELVTRLRKQQHGFWSMYAVAMSLLHGHLHSSVRVEDEKTGEEITFLYRDLLQKHMELSGAALRIQSFVRGQNYRKTLSPFQRYNSMTSYAQLPGGGGMQNSMMDFPESPTSSSYGTVSFAQRNADFGGGGASSSGTAMVPSSASANIPPRVSSTGGFNGGGSYPRALGASHNPSSQNHFNSMSPSQSSSSALQQARPVSGPAGVTTAPVIAGVTAKNVGEISGKQRLALSQGQSGTSFSAGGSVAPSSASRPRIDTQSTSGNFGPTAQMNSSSQMEMSPQSPSSMSLSPQSLRNKNSGSSGSLDGKIRRQGSSSSNQSLFPRMGAIDVINSLYHVVVNVEKDTSRLLEHKYLLKLIKKSLLKELKPIIVKMLDDAKRDMQRISQQIVGTMNDMLILRKVDRSTMTDKVRQKDRVAQVTADFPKMDFSDDQNGPGGSGNATGSDSAPPATTSTIESLPPQGKARGAILKR